MFSKTVDMSTTPPTGPIGKLEDGIKDNATALNDGEPGDYVLRASQSNPGRVVLSFVDNNSTIQNIRLERGEHGIFNKIEYNCPEDLVCQYFAAKNIPLDKVCHNHSLQ